MGKKVHPIIIRIPLINNWSSQWFSKICGGEKNQYCQNLKEDWQVREALKKNLKSAALEKIEIKRSPQKLNIIIHSARPGFIIGKGGKEIELLKKKISNIINPGTNIKIDIQEIRKPECHAAILARSMAEQIERRVPYRRVLKQTLSKIPLGQEIQGVKIRVSGRLNGNEIARREWLAKGRMPLSSFRANIDYALDEAKTVYGVIGIKVWLYKGDILEEKKKNNS